MALTDDPTPVLVDLAAGRDPRIVSDAGTRWLEVDLGGRFPIHSVALRPGGGVVPPEPGDVAVAVSQDGATWIEPDLAGWSATPDALVAAIVPDERAWARAVRVAAPEPARIVPVAVRAEEAAVDLIALRAMLGLDVTLLNEKSGANVYVTYNLQSAPDRASRALVGLSLFENGAFGNCLVQYIIAVSVAKALNLKVHQGPQGRPQQGDLPDRAADLRRHHLHPAGRTAAAGRLLPVGSVLRPDAVRARDRAAGTDGFARDRAERDPAAVQRPAQDLPGQARRPAPDPHPLGRHLQHLGRSALPATAPRVLPDGHRPAAGRGPDPLGQARLREQAEPGHRRGGGLRGATRPAGGDPERSR